MLKQSSTQLLSAERCIELNSQPDVCSMNGFCLLFYGIIAIVLLHFGVVMCTYAISCLGEPAISEVLKEFIFWYAV